jgi:hypothetical protein
VRESESTWDRVWGWATARLAAGFEAFEAIPRKRRDRGFFLGALLIYFVLQMNLSVQPLVKRVSPVEVDDSYGYILKAEQMRAGCFLQDCPALVDLREQFLSPAPNPDLGFVRHREYHRVLEVFHPLHSAVLVGFEAVGLTAEGAFDLVSGLGKLLITLAIVYWLHSLWEDRTTAVTLLLLAPAVFYGQGFNTVVPSNISLGVGFLLWAEMFSRKRRVRWLLLPLVLVLILLHPIGRVYAALALVFFVAIEEWPLRRGVWVAAGASALSIVLAFLIPEWVSQPALSSNMRPFYPGDWSYLDTLIAGAGTQWEIVSLWTGTWGGHLVAAGLVVVGLIGAPKKRMRGVALAGAGMLGILALSLLYVVPWYGSISFRRVWVAAAIFLTGLVARALVVWGGAVYEQLREIVRSGWPKTVKGPRAFTREGWRIAGLAIVSLLLAQSLANYFSFEGRHYFLTLDNLTERAYYDLDETQPRLLEPGLGADNQTTVLYMKEIPLYSYMANGALDYGAVYYPAIAGTSDEEEWLVNGGANIDYVVGSNPIYKLPHTQDGAIQLDPGTRLEIRISSANNVPMDGLEMLVVGEAASVQMEASDDKGTNVRELEVPAGVADWVALMENGDSVRNLELRVEAGGAIEIYGLRFGPSNTVDWPWEQGVHLTYSDADGETQTIEISEAWLNGGLPLSLEVLGDEGFSVLARVVR